MIAKFVAFLAVAVAVVVAEPCGYCGGYLSSGLSGYGSRYLNLGCSVPVVSAAPECSPIATPTCVQDIITTPVVTSTPVITTVTPIYTTGVVSSGVFPSEIYGGYGYGSSCCRNNIIATSC